MTTSVARNLFQDIGIFVKEHDVLHSEKPVVFDSERHVYVAHESVVPDGQFQTLYPRIVIDSEGYFLLRKTGGFRPVVVK